LLHDTHVTGSFPGYPLLPLRSHFAQLLRDAVPLTAVNPVRSSDHFCVSLFIDNLKCCGKCRL
jgi:hypothetical protein